MTTGVVAQPSIEWCAGDIAELCSGELVAGEPVRRAVGLSTDSRSICPDQMFVALEGRQYDGHNFADAASAAGASILLVAEKRAGCVSGPTRGRSAVVAVPDTLKALQLLANAHRRCYSMQLLAITGSCGKTTVKEMVAAVAAQQLKVTRSRANFNNEIGVPLSLFELRPDTGFCVIEMGINAPGELTCLCEIAEPTAGLITNIGRAHLEGFGSVENVAAAKGELADYLAGRGPLIISVDDRWCRSIAAAYPGECITFGESPDAQVRAVCIDVNEDTRVTLADEPEPYVVNVPGRYSAHNALAAIALGRWLGVTRDNIQAGLLAFERLPRRMVVTPVGRATVIDDTYNANPDSVCAAIDMLAQRQVSGGRIAVLGDMKELGEATAELHRLVGSHAARSNVDVLVAVGEWAEEVVHGARDEGMDAEQCFAFETRDAAVGMLVRYIFEPNVILVKGSRAARMEEIVDSLSLVGDGR